MTRWTTPMVGLALLAFSSAPAFAADDAGKPVGSWTRTRGEMTIKFDIKAADAMTVLLKSNDGASIKVEATYTIKDGVLAGVIKKIEKVGVDGGPAEGDKFGFRFKVDKEKMTLSDLTGAGADSDEIKQLVEGEYKKEK